MSLDIVAGLIIVGFVGLGFRSGAKAQLLRLGGLAVAFFGAASLARLVTHLFYSSENTTEPILMWGMTALMFMVLYTAIAIVGHMLLRRDGGPSKKDRLAGACIGLAKALLLTLGIGAAVLLSYDDLSRIDPQDRLHVRDSLVLASCRSGRDSLSSDR